MGDGVTHADREIESLGHYPGRQIEVTGHLPSGVISSVYPPQPPPPEKRRLEMDFYNGSAYAIKDEKTGFIRVSVHDFDESATLTVDELSRFAQGLLHLCDWWSAGGL